MLNPPFEEYKVARELRRSGRTFLFLSPQKNEFNELIPPDHSRDFEYVPGARPLTGIYHEQASVGIRILTTEPAQVPSERIPMILCLYSEASAASIEIGDYTQLGGSVYRVTGITDIQQWGSIADISLEVANDVAQHRL